MCRTGGRRCETHWTQTQKDADNARRRAAYAAKKSTLMNSDSSVLTQDKLNILMNEQKHSSQKQVISASEDKTNSVAATVVTSSSDQSYLDYGFTKPGNLDEYSVSPDVPELIANARVESVHKDLPLLAYRERAALSVFASRSYQTINLYLHDSPIAEPLQETGVTDRFDHQVSSDKDYITRMEDDNLEEEEGRSREEALNIAILDTSRSFYYHELINANNLQDYVTTVDDAFKKAPGTERTLYRGEAFGNTHHEGTLEEYVEGRMSVGSKLTFKGLQSTSLSEKTAKSFGQVGTSSSIIYQIKSPSGINISGVSPYPDETEVLLPRNTQYRVVGVHYLPGQNPYTKASVTTAVVQMVEIDENDNVRTKDNLRTEFGEFDAHKFVKKEGN